MIEDSCKVLVPDGGRSVNFHRCRRNAVKDGYCKQHHPDTVAKRDEERRLRWEEKQNTSPIRKLAQAMEKIKELEAENTEYLTAIQTWYEYGYYRAEAEELLFRASKLPEQEKEQ